MGLYHKYLEEHPPPPTHVILDTTANAAVPGAQQAARVEDYERLSRLDLPKFGGEFTKWEGFRDMFQSFIANKPNIYSVSKLNFLRMCLYGEAENLVNSFPFEEKTFDLVLKKLVSRYQVKRRLIHAHIHLYSITPISKSSSSELKRILDSITTPVAALKLMHRPVEF